MAVFHITWMADSLGRTVPLTVILPTDKVYFGEAERREEGKPYKTLYLLHGIIGDHTDWLYGTRIARWAAEKDLCVVMPAGENMFYVDQEDTGNYYGEMIGRELVEFTRKTFPLSHNRDDTYIAGLSMGGYGAIRNGLKYANTFGAIAGLSSALIVDKTLLDENPNPRFPAERKEWRQAVFGKELESILNSDKSPEFLIDMLLKEKKPIPALYMACGTEDPLLDVNEQFVCFLKSKGVSVCFEKGPGGHGWDFWDTYIRRVLDWLPLEDTSDGRSSGNVGL